MRRIRFTCHCGRRLAAPASAIGKRSACPNCGSSVVVPEQPQKATDVPVGSSTRKSTPKTTGRKARSQTKMSAVDKPVSSPGLSKASAAEASEADSADAAHDASADFSVMRLAHASTRTKFMICVCVGVLVAGSVGLWKFLISADEAGIEQHAGVTDVQSSGRPADTQPIVDEPKEPIQHESDSLTKPQPDEPTINPQIGPLIDAVISLNDETYPFAAKATLLGLYETQAQPATRFLLKGADKHRQAFDALTRIVPPRSKALDKAIRRALDSDLPDIRIAAVRAMYKRNGKLSPRARTILTSLIEDVERKVDPKILQSYRGRSDYQKRKNSPRTGHHQQQKRCVKPA